MVDMVDAYFSNVDKNIVKLLIPENRAARIVTVSPYLASALSFFVKLHT